MTNMKSLMLAAAAVLALGTSAALADEGRGADARPYFQASTVTSPTDASQYRAAMHTHEVDVAAMHTHEVDVAAVHTHEIDTAAAGNANYYSTGSEARDGGNR